MSSLSHRSVPKELQGANIKSLLQLHQSPLQPKKGHARTEQEQEQESTLLIDRETNDIVDTMNSKHPVVIKEERVVNNHIDNEICSEITTETEEGGSKNSKGKKNRERLLLKERQLKQMQDMLLLQEKEWADLDELTSSPSSVSLVSLPP